MELYKVGCRMISYLYTFNSIEGVVYLDKVFALVDTPLIVMLTELSPKVITSLSSKNSASNTTSLVYFVLRNFNKTKAIFTKSAYVFGSLYSRYSLSKLSEAVFDEPFLTLCSSFASGNMPAKQASPPIVSQASAGNTLNHTKNNKYKVY
ncbi:hypothetical protein TorRG33x02_353480 [Trema orientale]|uniref:Uncharacterized protein n=1 Tax=Trema orientale TaxID=63057 RepID=A0A2P5ACV6_TREOI|nr:hypothetical protein TorRG33x02_353480 [Trema orientale]